MNITFASFTPPGTATPVPGTDLGAAHMSTRWQGMSEYAALQAFRIAIGIINRTYQGDLDKINRLVEIWGLVGSIGEQVGLAWTALQDSARWETRSGEPAECALRRMAVRGLCEMSAHFSLGAAHGVANLVLRVLLLDDTASRVINSDKKFKEANGFPPGTTNRHAWKTFSPKASWVKALRKASQESSGLRELADDLLNLKGDHRFKSLDERRGMDYHRHRPQSVPQSATRLPAIATLANGTAKVVFTAPHLDPASDELGVHKVASNGLAVLVGAMSRLEHSIPAAIRSVGLDTPPFNVGQ